MVTGPPNRGGTSDLLRRYLDEIGAHPLLTAEDEVTLARAMRAGLAAEAELGATPRPSPARRRQLDAIVSASVDARRRFIQTNLRLVVSVARRYEHSGLPLLDLIQEGNIGLIRAVERFDPERGLKFSTYATWWIRQAIGKAIAESSRTIKVPAHVRESYSLVDQSAARLEALLDRQPTPAEVAADTGLTRERVELVRRHRDQLISLSARLAHDSDTELADTIEDDEAEAPYEAAAAALEREALRSQLARLHPRERRVLELRFGLATDHERTLAEVGAEFHLTRERIRQIEAKALGKLRHPSLARAWSSS